MIQITSELAYKIGSLALDFTSQEEFEKTYSVSVGGTTIWRNFEHKDLLCSLMLTERDSILNKINTTGIHINIMNNGDIFARNFPYYDGELQLIAIYNQRKIYELIQELHSKNIVDMTVNTEIKERLAKRLQVMKEATNPNELSFTIWTKQLEEAMGSSRQAYRDCFIEWIIAYKEKRKPNLWNKYQTPEDVAEAVWPKNLEMDESDNLWFGSLRAGLIEWINNYCGNTKK